MGHYPYIDSEILQHNYHSEIYVLIVSVCELVKSGGLLCNANNMIIDVYMHMNIKSYSQSCNFQN